DLLSSPRFNPGESAKDAESILAEGKNSRGCRTTMAAQARCETNSNEQRRTHSAEDCCVETIGPRSTKSKQRFLRRRSSAHNSAAGPQGSPRPGWPNKGLGPEG